jgi:hypothetical protein
MLKTVLATRFDEQNQYQTAQQTGFRKTKLFVFTTEEREN